MLSFFGFLSKSLFFRLSFGCNAGLFFRFGFCFCFSFGLGFKLGFCLCFRLRLSFGFLFCFKLFCLGLLLSFKSCLVFFCSNSSNLRNISLILNNRRFRFYWFANFANTLANFANWFANITNTFTNSIEVFCVIRVIFKRGDVYCGSFNEHVCNTITSRTVLKVLCCSLFRCLTCFYLSLFGYHSIFKG